MRWGARAWANAPHAAHRRDFAWTFRRPAGAGRAPGIRRLEREMPSRMNPGWVPPMLLDLRPDEREQLELRAFTLFGEQRCGQHRPRPGRPASSRARAGAPRHEPGSPRTS